MKIVGVDVYQVDLPIILEGGFPLSGGRNVTMLDDTIVRLTTDEGLVGWGESCPFGPDYLPAFASGVRAAMEELAPAVMGLDPRDTAVVYGAMDRRLYGHGYAKAAIDMACWDLLGRAAGLPLVTLLGGRRAERIACHAGLPAYSLEAMIEGLHRLRDLKCRHFSVKMSGKPDKDIATLRRIAEVMQPGESAIADANGGWTVHAAVQVMNAVADLPYTYEQPCFTYEECLAVRRLTSAPIMLDECLQDVETVARAWRDRACESVKLKVAKLGGLTQARLARDLAAQMGLTIMVDGVGGSELTNAEIAHLALSTPPAVAISAFSCISWAKGDITDIAVDTDHSTLAAPSGHGLGVTPRLELLGEPLARYTSHG